MHAGRRRRLGLSRGGRRPDPAPARTDARKALLVGTAAWLVVLAFSLVWRDAIGEAAFAVLLPTAIIGAVLGVAGLVVVQLRRRRAAGGGTAR